MVMLQQTLEFIFPAMIVSAFFRSFVADIVLGLKLPTMLMNLMTCPLCLGFHVSWIWLFVRFGMPSDILFSACYVAASSVLCYFTEHTLQCVTNANTLLQLKISKHEER